MISIIIMGNLFTTCLIVTTIILCIPTLAIAIDNTRYDLDRSGSIDPGDIDVLYRYINDPTAPYLPYDLNNDSEVNIYDMQLVTSHIGEPVSWPTPNLLANPGFEYGTTTPINWSFVTSNTSTPSWDANVSHTGARSIRIQVTGIQDDTSGYPRSDLITARPLTYYNFSARVKTLGANGTNAPAVRVVELDAAQKIVRQTNLTFSKGTNDWTQKMAVFKTDINTSYVYLDAGIVNGYGTLWVDDVSFELFAPELVVSTAAGDVYLVNKSPEINMSIRSSNLDTFKFNWNGTNYSFYDSSLVLAMNFNNNSAIGENATRAVDISNYGNNGSIVGATWTTDGRFGGAMRFDGVNDYVDVGNGTSLDMGTNDFTIEAWVKSINSTYGRGIVSKGSWSNIGYFISNSYSPADGLYFGIRDSGGYKSALFFKSSTYNWTHLVGIKTNNHLEAWVNGVKMNEYNGTIGSISNSGLPLTIGKSSNGFYFNGSIDEVRIYNRALSINEIKMHYQSEFQKYNAIEWRFYENISWCQCGRDKFGSDLNPTGDAIGGGEGYSKIIDASTANYIVNNKSELLSALSSAVSKDVIYIDDSAEINLTLERDIVIPANVTLASGRGRAGSSGALLYSNNISIGTGNTSEVFQLFKTGGNGIKVSGIRLRGPDTEIRNSPYEFSNSRGIYSMHDVEVENSELSGWSHCAVCLDYGSKSNLPRIHHNFIHHNRRSGLGYGIALYHGANSMIEANVFDWNRHSIAGDGRENTSYTARYNLVFGNGNSHSFDMHGGADLQDGTNRAGETINIYSNTFYEVLNLTKLQPAIVIRGIPTNGASIHDNYLYYNLQEYPIQQTNAFGNMYIHNNCYNGNMYPVGDGTYSYYGWASDIVGNSNSSELRTITVK